MATPKDRFKTSHIYKEAGVLQTNAAGRRLILESVKNELFLLAVAVTAHELVHATGGIDKLLLTGEEGGCDELVISSLTRG